MKSLASLSSTLRCLAIGACLSGAVATTAHADAVTDWNIAFENSLVAPAERGPGVSFRTLSILHAAVFDAVNSIERKYEPLFVTDPAPPGARAEAAAIQAAYTILSALRPTAQVAWDAQLAASLATLPGHPGAAQSIARGREWGTTVANAIIAWRPLQVAPGPFVGSAQAGFWRHAPLAATTAVGYVYTIAPPFLLDDPMAFDPGPPYGFANRADALASAAYAADVNEIKARGGVTSSVRTPAELDEALFFDACDLASLNGLLRSKLHPHARLVDNARAFALLNMAWYDAVTVVFSTKYHHALWRPFQAIRYAAEDNNPATEPDATWNSFIPTPTHPEYVSAHVTLFTTLLQVIAHLAGDCGPVEFSAAASTAYPGGTKQFASLADISDGCADARVNIGFHFRETVEISQILGRAIGDEIVENHLLPLRRHDSRHCRRD